MNYEEVQDLGKQRAIKYIVLFVVLAIIYWLLRSSTWTGNTQLHTIMEVLATVLALFVGVLALVRYYTKKSNTFLFIGAGFLGTAFLDGYHTVVTSSFFNQIWQNPPEALIPWSWNASRYFLGVMMVVSYLAWRKEKRLGSEKGKISSAVAYTSIGAFALVAFAFFILYPLPRAYYPELSFGRPEEFGAAILFLVALIGYLTKGLWKTSKFEHWVVYSLIAGFMGQALFMSRSYHLFDTMFDSAHTLKKVSYICVLIGLLISMSNLFRQVEEGKVKMEKAFKETEEGRVKMEKAFREAEENKKELEEINRYMTGRELKMIELKKEVVELKKDR